MTIGQILILCAIPVGLLAGASEVQEGNFKRKQLNFGLWVIASVLALLLISYFLSQAGQCTQQEALLLTKYCGPGFLNRLYVGCYISVVLSACVLIVVSIKRIGTSGKAP